MAGDWIKMRCDLTEDPAVISLSQKLQVGEYAIVGALHKLWSWANKHTSDGNAAGVTELWIDRYIGIARFAQNLVDVGWLALTDAGVQIPNFDRHNSKSAKARAVTAKRVEKIREKCNGASVTKSLPEKRREEKSIRRDKGTTWLTPFFDLWRELYDSDLPASQYASDLKKLVDHHGTEKVVEHLRRYLSELSNPSFISIPKFASTFGAYSEESRNRRSGKAGQNLGRVQAPEGKYDHVGQKTSDYLFEPRTEAKPHGADESNNSEH
jgi:hypothetical protein